ncbi:MAG: glycosyltransferase family 2 protein [Proteobacteria bacterium]|nr:glycosyltransferase family 2 protein [Pseudomonadota bacterium]
MNRKEILERCLRSVRSQVYPNMEIIVVDNASCDGTGEMVQGMFPEARYFYLKSNLGPAGGRNCGVRNSRGEFCVFIDDDALIVGDDVLKQVVKYFRSDIRLGCIAFRIVDPMDGEEISNSIPRIDKKSIQKDYECSYFCGAGFACRRILFLEIGMFWEPLFYYVEELDFSYRLVSSGYRILRSSAISVSHEKTLQARVKGEYIYYGVRNRCWVAARNLPWIYVFSHIFLWCGYYFVSAVRSRHLFFFLRGIRDAIIGLSEVMKSRNCLSRGTMRKIKALSGRFYY